MDSKIQIFEFGNLIPDHKEIIELDLKTEVYIKDAMFNENIVSKISIERHVFQDGTSSIFVAAFMGNIELCEFIFKTDVVVEIENMKFRKNCRVRKRMEYDHVE